MTGRKPTDKLPFAAADVAAEVGRWLTGRISDLERWLEGVAGEGDLDLRRFESSVRAHEYADE